MRRLRRELHSHYRSLLLLFHATLIVVTAVNGQVWTGNLTLATQAEVDAFNYTSVTGNLLIKGQTTTSILNLNGLSELTTVGGFLIIEDNSSLTNIIGLANLTTVGNSLDFERNNSLTSMDGLSSLTSIGNALLFFNNSALVNLNGLSHVTHVTGGLNINGNSSLTNVDGLSNIPGFGNFIHVEGNSALTNLDGLSQITIMGGDLEIKNNFSLLNIDGLANITRVFGDINIESNPALTSVLFSKLTAVDGRFEIHSNNGLLTINLSKLTVAGAIFTIAFNPLLTGFDLSKLTAVGGHFTITSNPLLTDINSLSSLTSIDGNFGVAGNNLITNLDALSKLNSVTLQLGISNNAALTDFCGLYNLFNTGTIGGAISIKNNGANTVTFTPSDVTVNAAPGLCSAVIPNASIPDPINGCLVPVTKSHTDFPAGNIFFGGTTAITWTATDGAGNTVSGVQNITVVDNQPPVITSCPANLTVSCAADVPAANVNLVTATDNCSVTVTHVGDDITNQTCANQFTVTRTYAATDGAGNTARCSQVITVNDNTPPQINSLSPSQTILWPPNHTMRDITVNYTVTDNCTTNATTTVTVTSNEPLNGTADGDTDPDWIVVDNHHIKLRAERAANGTGRIYTITVTTTDGCNAPVSASTQVTCVHNITGPQSGKPFIVGSTVNFSGEFWDKPTNKHTSRWLIDGSTSVKGTTTEPTTNKNGRVTGSYKFTSPGVYKLQMNITDQNNVTSYANTNGDIEEIVVIYDPNGGYTYGGGWFDSPASALVSDPTATGKASYGFAMNYFKNSTYPKGEAQFEFKVGDFEFNALNFDYMVINNSMAQFKGTGKIIGGQSGVGFTMTVVDGQLDGSGIDKIRMKIYNKNNGSIIYDNQAGASDAALPTQAVGENSTIVIGGTNATQSSITQKAVMEAMPEKTSIELGLTVYPNPTANDFSVFVQTNAKEKIMIQVIDMYGRIIEVRNVSANSVVQFGERFRSGTYFVRVIQGKQHKELKLVKLSN